MDNNTPYVLTQNQNYAIEELNRIFNNNFNPICSLPVGEGKTIIACTIIKKQILEGSTRILIIVRANNLRDPWITELNKFGIKYFLIHGKKRKKKRINDKYITRKGYVFLTSHDTSTLDIESIINTGQFDLLVVDEIHSIINSKKMTQKCNQLIRINSFKKLFISANPIQNRREELGLIYILLNKPETYLLLNQSDEINDKLYDEAYHEAIERKIIVQINKDKDNDKLQNNLKIEKNAIILSIPLYEEMEEFIKNNRGYLFIRSREKFHYSHRLEQFLSHPNSINKNNTIVDKHLKCGKLDTVDIIVKNIPRDEKIIIYSLYKDVLFHYSMHLKSNGFETITITGEDKTDLKEKLNLFKKNIKFNILLSTLFKSAEGINMPEANHVIILEFWWNPQKIIQAIGRIDRYNQKKNIFAYLLCYNRNGEIIEIDSKVYEIMNVKINEAKKVVYSQQMLPEIKTFFNELTFIDELKNYLQGYINKNPCFVIEHNDMIESKEKKIEKEFTMLDILIKMQDIRPLSNQSHNNDSTFNDIDLSEISQKQNRNNNITFDITDTSDSDIEALNKIDEKYGDIDLSSK